MSKYKKDGKHFGYNDFKRTRYFHGMLMTDRDFREEQIYHSEKRKLLNRMLYGWGVVYGFDISSERGKSIVTISPGMAFDCHGNEILVCSPVNINLASLALPAKTPQAGTIEYCQAISGTGDTPVYYICVRYHEAPTVPVPVYSPGGGCEEKACDHSRIREGFCVDILDHQPCQPSQYPDVIKSLLSEMGDCFPAQTTSQTSDSQEAIKYEQLKTALTTFCPEPPLPDTCCPDEHYLILGSFQLSTNKNILDLDLNDGRVYVPTVYLFRHLFSSIASGIQEFFELTNSDSGIEIPDVNLIHTNPIRAMCWLSKELPKIKPKKDFGQLFRRQELQIIELNKKIEELKNTVRKFQKGDAEKRKG